MIRPNRTLAVQRNARLARIRAVDFRLHRRLARRARNIMQAVRLKLRINDALPAAPPTVTSPSYARFRPYVESGRLALFLYRMAESERVSDLISAVYMSLMQAEHHDNMDLLYWYYA